MSSMPTSGEAKTLVAWYRDTFLAALQSDRAQLPLSFSYDGKSRPDDDWAYMLTEERKEAERAFCHTLTLTDPVTGLQLRCEITEYEDFPAIEWVAHFTNTGTQDTPIIADILPLDCVFPVPKETVCTLHHAKGSDCRIDDFEPLTTPLGPSAEARIGSTGGRSSNGALPFFNLQTGDRGVVGAVGWTGDWKAEFARDAEGAIRVCAGMRKTRLKLHPGEAIRTPRMLLLFWEGERLHGHNMLRQFLLAHHSPRPNGELVKTPVCVANWGENHAANQIAKARWWHENDIPLDVFWIDAGWHGDGEFLENSTVFNSSWWRHVGNWRPNKTSYPEGLGPIGDACRELGYGFLLWLEPERVFRDTYLTSERPEWLLGPIGDNWLLDLGNPEACAGLTDLISNLITEGGITWYRQDFNFEPAPYWEAADAPDRVGISEIRHIEGLYAYWDALLERHPGLCIDNCSSGGRRIDLETISRSVPLWRSDFQCYPDFDPLSQQTQTQGLGMWVPLNTGCCDRVSDYAFRSALGPGVVLCTSIYEQEPSKYFDTPWIRARMKEQAEVGKYFYGDLYPLLSWSVSTDVWAAWQLDRPDLGEGMVLALRRQESPFTQMQAKLRGLDPNATYEVESRDTGRVFAETGSLLMENGLTIEIVDQPGSALIVYRRVR